MKMKKHIFLLLLLMGITSCTEKVAKELTESNSTDPILPPATVLKTFEVKAIKADDNDSTIIHLANELGSEKCIVEAPSLDPNAPVIKDCVVDVNELDLYFNGLEINIDVSDKLCEYVAFRPYKYYTNAPGVSSGSYTMNECDPTCQANGVACPANTAPPSNACLFTYGTTNCDLGGYTITTNTQSWNGASCDVTSSVETVECGGEVINCLASPVGNDVLPDMTYGGEIVKVNEAEFVKEYTMQAPIQRPNHSNIMIANFTRYCSGVDPSLTDVTGLNLSFLQQFNQTAASSVVSGLATGQGAVALANSPTFGSGSQPLYRVQCLDQAYDVKAEIRFVVREWDKDFQINEEGLSYVRLNNRTDVGFGGADNALEDLDDLIESNFSNADPGAPAQPNYFGTACYSPGAVLPAAYNKFFFIGEDL